MEKESMDTKEEEAKLEMIRREEENRRVNLLLMGEKEAPFWSIEDERKFQKEKRDIKERQGKGKGVQEIFDQSQDESVLTKEAGTSKFSTLPLTSLLNHQLSVYATNSQGQTSQHTAQNQVDFEEEYIGKRDTGDNFGPLGHKSLTPYQFEVEDIIKESKHIFAIRENKKEGLADESDRSLQSKDQTEHTAQQRGGAIVKGKGKSKMMSSEESSYSPSESDVMTQNLRFVFFQLFRSKNGSS